MTYQHKKIYFSNNKSGDDMELSKYKGVTSNSKKVKKDFIFVSINSNEKYINEAISKGASLIISKVKLNIKIDNIIVENIEYYFSYLYKKYYKTRHTFAEND